jgi:phthiocerol/phenolphthiocerol synthesis type-I polyketide synthase D
MDDAGVTAELVLYDARGSVLVAASGVELRAVRAEEVPAPLSGKLIGVAWEESPLPARAAGHDDRPVVRLDGSGWGDPEALRAVVAQGGPGDVVVIPPADLTGEPLVLAVTVIVRALDGTGARLWFVTESALAWGPAEGRPGQAFLWALVRVLGFEHPALRATLLDVDDRAVVADELGAGTTDNEIVWRGGRRYAARLRPVVLDRAVRPRKVVRRGAAYVISGGYGGLGLATARLLAERGAARVVLSGRSGPAPAAEKIINELREGGLDVVVVLGDIAEPGVAERMVAAAKDGGLPLKGVVHAAGGIADRLVTAIGPEDLRTVWEPKVTGAWRLHEATEAEPLDWWVGYSSAAALLGSPGQGAYAAANAALDAIVDWRRARGLPAATIDWGTWGRVGGAAGLSVAVLDPLTPGEGVAAFEALVAHDVRGCGVLRFDPRQALGLFPEIRAMPLFAGLVAGVGEDAPDDWPGPEALRSAEPATARAMVAARLSGRVAAILGYAPDRAVPLTELGLDSLVAIRIKSAVEHDLGLDPPASLLLQGAGVADLEAWAIAELGLAPAESTARPEPSPRTGVRAPKPASPLIRPLNGAGLGIGSGNGAPPLFCVHAAGGTADVYRGLAEQLGDRRPVVGLERFADAPSVGERADRYIELIRTVQPDGPYRLAGWSFGGVVGYEMARRLGPDQVELLAMLDSGLPKRVADVTEVTARRYADFGRHLRETYGADVRLDFEELRALDEDGQLALVTERAAPVMERLPPAVVTHQITSHEDTRSLERYRPGPFAGPAVLYRSTEPTPWTVRDRRYDLDDDRGFGGLCASLEIVPIAGAHHLNLLDPPGVGVIAAHLRGRLER